MYRNLAGESYWQFNLKVYGIMHYTW